MEPSRKRSRKVDASPRPESPREEETFGLATDEFRHLWAVRERCTHLEEELKDLKEVVQKQSEKLESIEGDAICLSGGASDSSNVATKAVIQQLIEDNNALSERLGALEKL